MWLWKRIRRHTVYLSSASELTFNIIASNVPTNDVDVECLGGG